ncbi:reductase [Nocardioides marmoriginsengisoli]|uniref:Reductase n=1 Tax=Nocardioides marmoriginsengisoli TaxID=661483 RepID=A0A3N0CCL8_9ACTN|nr:NAD-dependent epimerase/dehydratase family protein [Nocardioides marmoriginsengisoli]RNL61197.1 reductase [Nocardioides marmoriginsengisoli]
MRVLVLGGTHHVGRAAVETALGRGDTVTTVTRGVSGTAVAGAEARYADRRDPAALAGVLGTDTWDLVLDTWSSEPVAVRTAARLLADRVERYAYVSSRSVYTWPPAPGADESAPVVEADAGAGGGASESAESYAAAKRGGELAVLETFGPERSLLARAGLVLGPYEVVGRLPWWLDRIAAGGRVPAPGPADRPLQYVDGRDLVAWMLTGVTGTYNAVSRPGHTTIGALLDACLAATGSGAELVPVTPEQVEEAGVSGWTDLPIWVPPTGELAGLHDADTSAAAAAGLRCRPVEETVTDTWAWLRREGTPTPPSGRGGDPGLTPEQEAALLEAAGPR